MKTLITCLFLFVSPAIASAQWPAVAKALEDSVIYVEMDKVDGDPAGSCTGIVIAKDHLLTAAHCYTPTMFAAGRPVKKVLFRDTKLDLLVVEVEGLGGTPVKFASKNPTIGEEIASYGYGYGLERPLFRVTHVSDDKTVILEDGFGGPVLAVDASFVPGQSGGPVVNLSGELVAIVQFGTERVGMGRGVEVIRDKVGKFIP